MTQRSVVERILQESGQVATHTLIYRFGITRAAAVIEELRKDGWDIETTGGQGELATYVLRSAPKANAPARRDLGPMERAQRAYFHRDDGPLELPEPSPMTAPCGCVRSADGRRWDARCVKHGPEQEKAAVNW